MSFRTGIARLFLVVAFIGALCLIAWAADIYGLRAIGWVPAS